MKHTIKQTLFWHNPHGKGLRYYHSNNGHGDCAAPAGTTLQRVTFEVEAPEPVAVPHADVAEVSTEPGPPPFIMVKVPLPTPGAKS